MKSFVLGLSLLAAMALFVLGITFLVDIKTAQDALEYSAAVLMTGFCFATGIFFVTVAFLGSRLKP